MPSPLFRDLDPVERQTFPRHSIATLFDAAFMAMCWSAADVVKKGFDASTLVIVLITMAPGAAQVLSLGMGRPMAKMGRRRLLRTAAWIGRVPLVFVFWVEGPYTFLALITVQAISQVAITTSWNSLLRTNYRDDRRGRLFAAATVGGAIASGVTTIAAGLWLDHNADAYRYIYPIAGVLGLLACHIFGEIEVRRGMVEHEKGGGPGPRRLIEIFFADRAFLRYELGFMLYGLAFMALMTAKPLRMAGQLDFSYTVLLGSKGVFAACMAISTFYMGRFMDRAGPAGLAARCYGVLVLYAILLIFVEEPPLYFVAEALIGLAMGGVHIAWNMGPVTLAPSNQLAGAYMQIHVALVGVRAIVGNPLGGIISEVTSDPRWVFALSALLFVGGTWVMWRLSRDPGAPHPTESASDADPISGVGSGRSE